MFAQHFLNCAALWLGKVCLLTMYFRIFSHIRKVKWQLYGTTALSSPIFVAIFLQSALVAPAPGKPWGTPNPLIKTAVIPGLMVGIDNLIVDILLAYIPISVLSGMKIERNKKIGAIAIFAMGGMYVYTSRNYYIRLSRILIGS